jgi:RND family efflux transporter MFP subunit
MTRIYSCKNAKKLGAFLAVGLVSLICCVDSATAQARVFDCLLTPRFRIKIATHVAGVLKEVPVDRGDIIRRGDVLARLESGVEQASLALAEARAENDATVKARQARLAFVVKKRDRIQQLQTRGIATDAALDEVAADYGVAVEELREARANIKLAELEAARTSEILKLRSILSPIDGVVAERLLLGGEYAYDQAPIMTIAQINPLNVEVFVPVALYGTVTIGMQAKVFGEQPVGGTYTAVVEVIDPLIDARSGTFGIRLVLPNPLNRIPAGLRCKIELPHGDVSAAKGSPEVGNTKKSTGHTGIFMPIFVACLHVNVTITMCYGPI